jgi:hypothetical protein
LEASECGLTQQQTVTKSVLVEITNPAATSNEIHNLDIVLTTSRQPNLLWLSFIYVNAKPEGEIGGQRTWVDTTADRYEISSCRDQKPSSYQQ